MKNIQYSYDRLLEEQEKQNKQTPNGTWVENKATYDPQGQPVKKQSKYIPRGNVPGDPLSGVRVAEQRLNGAIQKFGRRSEEAEKAYDSYEMSRAEFEKKQADELKTKGIRTNYGQML
jgi:hypothetical protein